MLRLPVAVCAWLLISAEALGFTLSWDGKFSADHEVQGRKALTLLASKWQALSFETLPAETIQILPLTDRPALTHGGRSLPGKIALSPLLSATDWPSVFGHELAHQLWLSHCGPTKTQDEIIHEAFALWVSDDSHRLMMANHDIAFISQARERLLRLKGRPLDHQSAQLDQLALARLMTIDDAKAQWALFFKTLVPQCRSAEKMRDEFWNLIANVDHQQKLGRIHYLLQDGLSGVTLSAHKPTHQPFPIGSILKPLTIQLLPALRGSLPSRDDLTWHCPSRPLRTRQWSWKQALVTSCNGFFLDHPIPQKQWRTWRSFWQFWDMPIRANSMGQAIGLFPGFELSLEKVLAVYQWLDLTSPDIIDVLRDTPLSGTIARAPDAQWFVRNQIALKTGSVRSSTGEPIHSWIVALGPRNQEGVSSFRAVIHGEGRATTHLLPELRRLLARRLWQQSNAAKVQVLGLVPLTDLRFSCPNGGLGLKRPIGQRWTLVRQPRNPIPMGKNTEWMCLGTPGQLHFKSRKGTLLTRSYYGRLRVESEDVLEQIPSSPLPTDGRRFRARRGSAVTLITSEGHYAEQVLASEFPRGHGETLKALAFGVLHNLHHSPHPDRPVCDTTHCQVFAHQHGIAHHLEARIRDSVEDVLNRRQNIKFEKEWFFFSLGGLKPWRKKISPKFIGKELALNGDINEIKPGLHKWLVSTKEGQHLRLKCEDLRNQLRLLSCPDSVEKEPGYWAFSGHGQGHGKGLSLIEADLAARAGKLFPELLP